jgi:hypothetical protein
LQACAIFRLLRPLYDKIRMAEGFQKQRDQVRVPKYQHIWFSGFGAGKPSFGST